MNHIEQVNEELNRRDFLKKTALGLGSVALASLVQSNLWGGATPAAPAKLGSPHYLPRAKRVIFLFQSGGPSQIELFDHKPKLRQMHGQEIPASVRGNQRLSGMVSEQVNFPLVGASTSFEQYGQSGAWMSDLLPYTSQIADDITIVKSLYTEAINHEPAVMFMQTGSQQNGRPCIGSWLSYGLGSANQNLPGFIVLLSKSGGDQPISANAWSNGFLPSHHQGVQFLSGKDPVLFLNNPDGVDPADRERALHYIKSLNQLQHQSWGDPEIESRISQYEMAYRMQTSVPEAVDVSGEPDYIYDMYGPDSRIPGTYAANCLLARRLAEKNVRFIQLYHLGWDHHGNLPAGIKRAAKDTDQASAALVKDLQQRGLLEDTLVVWGGEFGRTSFSQGKLTADNFGRDHHPRCFTMWLAGGGVKAGYTHGETDDFSYNVARDGVHVHDFQATLLHLLGLDHEQLTFKYQGRRFRLTDVHGQVVKELLA
jgi:hypothetical protein